MGATRSPRISGWGRNGMYPAQRQNQIGSQISNVQPYASGILQRRSPQEDLGFGGPPQPGSPIDSGPMAGGQVTRPPMSTLPARSPMDRAREMIDRARRMGRTAGSGAPPGSDSSMPGVRNIGNSFWSGDTLQVDTSNQQYRPLRDRLQEMLLGNMGGIQANRPDLPPELEIPADFSMNFSNLPEISRGMIRDVSGPSLDSFDRVRPDSISSEGVNIQSVDQMGGADSPFLSNVINQLQPTWDRQRQRALAQAKESAGNITGSGYGAMLARGLDDQMGRERQELMGYARDAMGMELDRQGQLAGYAQQRNLAAPEMGLRASLANQATRQGYDINRAELGQRAGLANQGADSDFIRSLLDRGGLGIQRDELGLRGGLANMENRRAYDTTRAGLGMDRYRTDAGLADSDAQRLTSLFGSLGTAGVGQDDLIQTGGAGEVLAALGGLLGSGAADGLFRGGGTDGEGNWGLVGDAAGGIWDWISRRAGRNSVNSALSRGSGNPTGALPGGIGGMPTSPAIPGSRSGSSLPNRMSSWFNNRLLRGRL